MENIGPVILFLLYMVISAWAKQKKNQRFQERKDKYLEPEEESAPPPSSRVESIFEQLKKELFEEEEVLPPPFMEAIQEESPEPLVEEYFPEDYDVPEVEEVTPFVEGSLDGDIRDVKAVDFASVKQEKSSLAEVIKPYSTIQQGIILHEILGKPRAMQPDEEWFHSH